MTRKAQVIASLEALTDEGYIAGWNVVMGGERTRWFLDHADRRAMTTPEVEAFILGAKVVMFGEAAAA